MFPQVIEPDRRVLDAWNRASWRPPEGEIVGIQPLKPILPLPYEIDVMSPVDKRFQCLNALPNGEIDQQSFIIIRPDTGGVAGIGLEAPDKSGAGIGQCIDWLESGNKTGHERVGQRCPDPADINLSEMPRGRIIHTGARETFASAVALLTRIGLRTLSNQNYYRAMSTPAHLQRCRAAHRAILENCRKKKLREATHALRSHLLEAGSMVAEAAAKYASRQTGPGFR